MRIGIDSYCYHRQFGEVYPQQRPAPHRMTLEDFLTRAHELKVDGVSLESCYINQDLAYLRDVKAMLDEYGFDRVWAWGHRDGLEAGTSRDAYEQMIRNLDCAEAIGATVMRVVGSSRRFRLEPHGPQLERLAAMFQEAIPAARAKGIRLALENHIDYNSDEILRLIQEVDSPWLGVNFDTGNFIRMLDDPIKGMEKLAPHVYATHVKDLNVRKGVPADEWFFFSSVPVGEGLVDNQRLVEMLRKADYEGFLAVEIDFLHPDYGDDEDAVVVKSLEELRRIASESERPPRKTAAPRTR